MTQSGLKRMLGGCRPDQNFEPARAAAGAVGEAQMGAAADQMKVVWKRRFGAVGLA